MVAFLMAVPSVYLYILFVCPALLYELSVKLSSAVGFQSWQSSSLLALL